MLISVVGIDGSGKTRLARALARKMNGLYRKQNVGKRFDRVIGQDGIPDLRILPSPAGMRLSLAYALDFRDYAARAGLAPQPDRDVFVDRWSACVQSFAAVFSLQSEAINSALETVRKPDLEILLDIDPSLAIARIQKRGRIDWDERHDLLSKLGEAYRALTGPSTSTLDASADFEVVFNRALSLTRTLQIDPTSTR